MDYGCGVGTTAPVLLRQLSAKSVLGVDISEDEITAARSSCTSPNTRFLAVNDYHPSGTLDLAYCNGVFIILHLRSDLLLFAMFMTVSSLAVFSRFTRIIPGALPLAM